MGFSETGRPLLLFKIKKGRSAPNGAGRLFLADFRGKLPSQSAPGAVMILPASVVRPRQQDGKIHCILVKPAWGALLCARFVLSFWTEKGPKTIRACFRTRWVNIPNEGRSVFSSVKSPGSWNKSTGEKCHLITELA